MSENLLAEHFREDRDWYREQYDRLLQENERLWWALIGVPIVALWIGFALGAL